LTINDSKRFFKHSSESKMDDMNHFWIGIRFGITLESLELTF